jgi:hypothetical protein
MKIAFVVPTVGRIASLRRLLTSLDGQLEPGDRIAIATVGDVEVIRTLISSFGFPAGCVSVINSPWGISTARNLAVASLRTNVQFLLFPNDTSWYERGFVRNFKMLNVTETCGAIEVVDETGAKFVLPAAGTSLTKANVWQVVEPGLFIDHGVFRSLGGFNEEFGTGGPTPWQSGEGTELLLRWMGSGSGPSFRWITELKVHGVSDASGLSPSQRRRKLRAYGRGYGRLLTLGNFSLRKRTGAALGGWLFGVRKGAPYKAADGLWVGLGRFEGLYGVTFRRAQSTVKAVDQ